MNLRYTLTRDMLIQLTELMLMRGPGFAEAQWTARKRSGLWMAFWLLTLFIDAVLSLVSEKEGFSYWILPSFVFFGLHLYHILFDTSRAMKLIHERAVREVDRRPADERTEEVDFQATADYFLISTSRARLALRPDQIKQIYYDDQLLYLFYQSDRALVVPQAAFVSEEARNALFNHLYRLNPPLYQATHRLALKDLIPKEGFFDSPVKIVAASLSAIGLGAVVFLMASPFIFEKYVASIQTEADDETREPDFTSHLPRVDDAETLARLNQEDQATVFWTPVTESSGPKKDVRCRVNLKLLWNSESPGASPEQLAAFTRLKEQYPELKPRMMAALLAAHERYRAERAVYQGDPEFNLDLPEIKNPEEMAARLTLREWTLFSLSRDGLVFVSLNYGRDWTSSRYGGDYGVLMLGDQVIYAGRQPDMYLHLDLNKEPIAHELPTAGPEAETAAAPAGPSGSQAPGEAPTSP